MGDGERFAGRQWLQRTSPSASTSSLLTGRSASLNASADGPVTGIITGYNDNGEETGSMEYNLPTHGNTTLDLTPLHASRITLSANNDPHGLGINVLVDALINNQHKGGSANRKTKPKITGKRVVEKLPPNRYTNKS